MDKNSTHSVLIRLLTRSRDDAIPTEKINLLQG